LAAQVSWHVLEHVGMTQKFCVKQLLGFNLFYGCSKYFIGAVYEINFLRHSAKLLEEFNLLVSIVTGDRLGFFLYDPEMECQSLQLKSPGSLRLKEVQMSVTGENHDLLLLIPSKSRGSSVSIETRLQAG
jgi:hypothetical protein